MILGVGMHTTMRQMCLLLAWFFAAELRGCRGFSAFRRPWKSSDGTNIDFSLQPEGAVLEEINQRDKTLNSGVCMMGTRFSV